MKLLNKPAIALFGLVFLVAAVPNSAHAKGSVHVDVPGFSIGWHDYDHRYRKKRRHRRHYDRHHDYYYDDYRPRRHYRKKHRRYYNKHYYDNYYYGGRSYYPRDHYYDRPRVVEVCPMAGYTRYRDRNRSCYEHKGHYHCD